MIAGYLNNPVMQVRGTDVAVRCKHFESGCMQTCRDAPANTTASSSHKCDLHFSASRGRSVRHFFPATYVLAQDQGNCDGYQNELYEPSERTRCFRTGDVVARPLFLSVTTKEAWSTSPGSGLKPAAYIGWSFARRCSAAASVSSFLQKVKRIWVAPSCGSL